MTTIASIHGREILDSRGTPTVEVELTTSHGGVTCAAVPSGSSTGSHEALELRDKDPKRYQGKGVLKAISNIEELIEPVLKGMQVTDQKQIDQAMIELDGTENKSSLGANAILAVSLAVARAGADTRGIPLYDYMAELAENKELIMPLPFVNVINGGAHAGFLIDIQEYMLVPVGAPSFSEAVRFADETFKTLQVIADKKGLNSKTVGDEGGIVPHCIHNEEPIKLIIEAIEGAGYTPGNDIAIALDVAASELYKEKKYILKTQGDKLSADEMIGFYSRLADRYPLVSLEDGLAEDDWNGWKKLTKELGNEIQIVGDDLFVTSTKRLQKGIKDKVANAVLIKPNQIGTLTETLDVIRLAKGNGYHCMISHRSGETNDSFIADLAVGTGVGQIKSGSMTRSERLAKYNQLMRIEEKLGVNARFAGRFALSN